MTRKRVAATGLAVFPIRPHDLEYPSANAEDLARQLDRKKPYQRCSRPATACRPAWPAMAFGHFGLASRVVMPLRAAELNVRRRGSLRVNLALPCNTKAIEAGEYDHRVLAVKLQDIFYRHSWSDMKNSSGILLGKGDSGGSLEVENIQNGPDEQADGRAKVGVQDGSTGVRRRSVWVSTVETIPALPKDTAKSIS